MSRRCARCSEKTSEAQFKEIRRDLGHDREGLFAVPRLPSGGYRPACSPLPIQAPGRRRATERDCGNCPSERRRFGYRRLYILLEREGWEVNWKKLYRIYREERLTVRKRGGRKRALGTRAPMAIPQGPAAGFVDTKIRS